MTAAEGHATGPGDRPADHPADHPADGAARPRWRVMITTADGRRVRWCKGGRPHTLSPDLGPVWIANFRPAVFQVLGDGSLIPRGSAEGAVDVVSVEIEPDVPDSPGR